MKSAWIYLLLMCLAIGCAKQTAPTGGPKDETPPKLKNSYPKHEQINFKGDRIELFFDEPIQLNNPQEQIIITPSVGKNFEVTYSKNRVTIDLKTRLKDSTTYNINFREAIQDMTEKNPATVKLAISTGSYIDSLHVNGKISDALTEKKLGNYTVALAEASDTFNIFKHSASWITLSNKRGFFNLENLKPGKYFIYAFDDKSKNLVVDSKSEAYGFRGEPINLTKNLDSLQIRTFKLDINPLKLMSSRITFAYFNVRFSKSLINYTATAIDTTRKVYSSLETDLSTIKFYNTIPSLDSLQVRVQATDSLNFSVDTLLYIKFPKKEATKDKLNANIQAANVTENNSMLSSSIIFSKPIITFNADSIFIEVDSATRIPFEKTEYTWNTTLTKVDFRKKINLQLLFPPDTSKTTLKPKKTTKDNAGKKPVSLIAQPSTFISVENDSTQRLSLPLKLTKLEATAIIEAKAVTDKDFIIQLVNRNFQVVDQRVNQKEVFFENLAPDVYLLRLIIDLNKNGKWDAGNFLTKTEPEPILYYRNPKGVKEISLKANWQLGPLLITY